MSAMLIIGFVMAMIIGIGVLGMCVSIVMGWAD